MADTLFSSITTEAENNKISTGIVSVAVIGGIGFGIYKKCGFLGTFGYALGFGIIGVGAATLIAQFNS